MFALTVGGRSSKHGNLPGPGSIADPGSQIHRYETKLTLINPFGFFVNEDRRT